MDNRTELPETMKMEIVLAKLDHLAQDVNLLIEDDDLRRILLKHLVAIARKKIEKRFERLNKLAEEVKRSHRHVEAYCLMQYEDTVTGEIEIIWNSRDGVTPFVITSKNGNEARHINWNQDLYNKDYLPVPGERIFVDMTESLARESAEKLVEKNWNVIEAGDHFQDMSRQEIVDYYSEFEPGQPCLITVENSK